MDSDPKDCYRLNLNDYYPQERNFNSVVYVHKRVAEKNQKPRKEKQKKEKEPKEKKSKKKGKHVKCDKYQQYNGQTAAVEFNNEMISAISSQVTKNIMPVLIPSGGTDSPVYYTIKASKKPKNKVDASTFVHDITYKKERSKKIIETYVNERANQKESFSVKETISYSSNNDTLDELHVNPSLCCTFSDASEQKKLYVKKEKREQTKHNSQKLLPSESFEALATEFLNMAGESKIKIHLMNETEKDLLAENIRLPLLRAIKDCVSELNTKTNLDSELVSVSKIVMSNSSKLDYVAQKLNNIEEKVDQIIKETEKVKAKPTPRLQLPVKASTSEELAQNRDNASGESSGDEYLKTLEARKRIRAQLIAGKRIERKQIENEMVENMGGGETAIDPDQSVQPDRLNRIPARFCWTDAGARLNTKT